MNYIETFDLGSLTHTFISLSLAFILGSAIGLERQIRQRTAGLRTNVLVCVAAAMFLNIAMRFYGLYGGTPSPLHVVAYVVSGVGFLGAGVIMREDGNIRGINTAATLWGSAAVGCAAGTGLIAEAILGTLFVLASNTMLRPIVNRINRQPLDTESMEATYIFYVIAQKSHQKECQKLLEESFGQVSIPLRETEMHPFGEHEIEIEVTILPTSISGHELDALAERIRREPYINQVFWSSSILE